MFMAKAIAAFIGAVVVALLSSGTIPVESDWARWLTIIAVISTAVATYAVPNRTSPVVRS